MTTKIHLLDKLQDKKLSRISKGSIEFKKIEENFSEIMECLNKGYRVNDIYIVLKDELNLQNSYSTFASYIRKLKKEYENVGARETTKNELESNEATPKKTDNEKEKLNIAQDKARKNKQTPISNKQRQGATTLKKEYLEEIDRVLKNWDEDEPNNSKNIISKVDDKLVKAMSQKEYSLFMNKLHEESQFKKRTPYFAIHVINYKKKVDGTYKHEKFVWEPAKHD